MIYDKYRSWYISAETLLSIGAKRSWIQTKRDHVEGHGDPVGFLQLASKNNTNMLVSIFERC